LSAEYRTSQLGYSIPNPLKGTLLRPADGSTSIRRAARKLTINIVERTRQSGSRRPHAESVANVLKAIADLVELAFSIVRWWRRRCGCGASACGSSTSFEKGGKIVFCILDAVTDAVVCVSKESVGSLALTG
jgi:hypothetical protein